MVPEKKIFTVCQCIFAFSLFIPLEKGLVLHLHKFACPTPMYVLGQRKWAHKMEIQQERWHIKKAEKL